MIHIITASTIYLATLLGCYDGDTCKIELQNAPPLVSTITLRFEGFDTPEIRGKCQEEKEMAQMAKNITQGYMVFKGDLYTDGKRGKYGRLLVRAPELQEDLIELGLARPYNGGKREGWCES